MLLMVMRMIKYPWIWKAMLLLSKCLRRERRKRKCNILRKIIINSVNSVVVIIVSLVSVSITIITASAFSSQSSTTGGSTLFSRITKRTIVLSNRK